MEQLNKIENDILYFSDQIYNANTSIDELDEKIKKEQKKCNRVDYINLGIAGASFLLYILGHAIANPIVIIVALLMLPSMAIVHICTNKIEKKINGYKETIASLKKDIASYEESLKTLMNKQEVQNIIDAYHIEQEVSTLMVKERNKINTKKRDR